MSRFIWGRRIATGLSGLLFVLGLSFSASAQEPVATQLSDSAIAQINALIAEKTARTPAQRKIDSQFIYTARMNAGQAIANGVQTLDTGVLLDSQGRTEIDVRIAVDVDSIALVKTLGGEIVSSNVAANSIITRFPISAVEALAADGRVRAIVRPLGATTNSGSTAAVDDTGSPSARVQRVVGNVVQGAQALGIETNGLAYGGEIRAAIPEGDVSHRARAARAAFGLDGTGLRVCVISDSFNRRSAGAELANDIASGDLPGVGNPNGRILPVQFAGSGELLTGTPSDEGRAMAQIVHSVLPGAQLYFATAFNNIGDFANNIAAMGGLNTFRGAPVTGTVLSPACHIIVDDIFYFAESGLHDGQATGVTSPNNMGIVTQAVNDVTAAGVLYFSSAGNSGNLNDNTSGAWEGDFVASATATPTALAGAGTLLTWSASAPTDVGNTISGTSTSPITMQWSDPLGAAANDYDIYRLNSTLTTVQAAGTNTQDGTQDPLESVSQAAGSRLVIALFTGNPRFISLSTNRGRLQYATSGQTRGHSTAANAFGTAATPTSPANGGPFPGPFVGSNVVETFSSDGLRRVFFDANNLAITAGNFLAATSGGLVRQKTDITAADGVPTSVPGFERFFGTSAAAPHAAAMSGLVREAFIKNGVASPTPAQIRNALTSTALDIETAGTDRDAGVGIIQAFQAIQSTGLASGAGLVQGTITAVERPGAGNGDTTIDPGDQGNLTIALDNLGTATATSISATLTTSTPGVTILNATRTYSDIASGASGSNALPFVIYVSPTFACAATIDFALTVTYSGGVSGRSPQVFLFRIGTGVTSASLTTQLDAAAPPANPLYAAAAVTQTGRLLGTGTASTCAAPKTNPGLSGNGPTLARKTDTYTFQNPGAARCVNVTVGFPVTNGNNFVGSGAYSVYTPATPTTGYLADLGSSFVSSAAPPGSGSSSYSFIAPAGAPFTLSIVEATSGGVPASPADQNTYTLAVAGLAVCKAPTATTTITSIAPASTQLVGVPYTVNATVTFGTSPTGTVTISDGAASCTITLPATSCNLTSTTTGTKTITATYNGDANNAANTAIPSSTYIITGPPNLAYAPTTGTTVTFTGVTTPGSTGSGTIAVTPSGGFGSGAGSTSTVNGCTVAGADAANFAGAGSVNLSFVGATTTAQSIALTCTSGNAARSATLSCNETLGTGAASLRTWPLACPVGASAPQFGYVPTTGTTVTATGGNLVGSTGALTITPSVATAGTGSGALATTTLTCTPPTGTFSGFAQTVNAIGAGAISGGPLAGSCTLAATTQTQTLSCSENRGGTSTPVSWTLSCPVGNSPPQFSYSPTTGSTVTATGGTFIGTSGALVITPAIGTSGSGASAPSGSRLKDAPDAIVPTAGPASTTTLTCTPPSAPFSGFGQTVTAVGAGAVAGGPLSGGCTLGAAAQTQTLTCSENRGGTAVPVSWTLACPAGALQPVTASPVTGASISFSGVVGAFPSSSTVTFSNPNPSPVTLMCTAPAAPFSVTPLTVNVPANGTQVATVSWSTLVAPGNYASTLSCSVAGSAQVLVFNLAATLQAAPPVDIMGDWSRLALLLLILSVGLGTLSVTRRQ